VIRLVVGLGNAGKEYERTRHNAGFWLVERFAAASGVALRKDPKYQALVGRLEGNGPWLLMPQTFMNSSGRAVQMLAGFFKVKPEEILVVHDELDFPPGTARIKQGGGIAGHNGLKDISQRIGSHDYWRLRLGVGRPSAEERAAIDASIENALGVLPQCIAGDLQGAMQKLHSQDKPAPAPKKEPEQKKEPEKKKESPKKEAPAKEPEKEKGFLKSLFGKK
jgi:PTH1 family peptidyl-tRNA hydrolase